MTWLMDWHVLSYTSCRQVLVLASPQSIPRSILLLDKEPEDEVEVDGTSNSLVMAHNGILKDYPHTRHSVNDSKKEHRFHLLLPLLKFTGNAFRH